MDKDSCSVPGCINDAFARGWCNTHYTRWHKTGSLHKKCKGCGEELPIESGQREYCGENCRPRCQVEGCMSPKRSRDGYCARHKAAIRRHGKPTGTYEWTPKSATYECLACGDKFPAGATRNRKFCSSRCGRLYRAYDGDIPTLDFECVVCGTMTHRNRWETLHQRSDKKLCDICRRAIRGTRHGVSSAYLAARDGTNCGICGGTVDLRLRHPDRWSPSVDHIVPVAHGGTHDESNLQLTHLTCNVRKQARRDYKPA